MNYYTAMILSFEKEKNRRAALLTLGVAFAMLLTFIFLKWPLPKLEPVPKEMYVEVDLGDLPPLKKYGGGGGGGNTVKATGPKGTAKPAVVPGVKEDSKDFETNDKDIKAPEVNKPANPKPVTNVNPNTSVVKETPKVVETPAPRVPKATAGKTLSGNGNGGGSADNYDLAGGNGNGRGVGVGTGYGGNTGGGSGGGNGTGVGTGNGPRRVSGKRNIITTGKLDAGENISGKVEAEIKVSPDGIGTLVRTVRGSLMSDGQAKDIIRDWLRRNKFNKTGEESVVVYEFNIRTGG